MWGLFHAAPYLIQASGDEFDVGGYPGEVVRLNWTVVDTFFEPILTLQNMLIISHCEANCSQAVGFSLPSIFTFVWWQQTPYISVWKAFGIRKSVAISCVGLVLRTLLEAPSMDLPSLRSSQLDHQAHSQF